MVPHLCGHGTKSYKIDKEWNCLTGGFSADNIEWWLSLHIIFISSLSESRLPTGIQARHAFLWASPKFRPRIVSFSLFFEILKFRKVEGEACLKSLRKHKKFRDSRKTGSFESVNSLRKCAIYTPLRKGVFWSSLKIQNGICFVLTVQIFGLPYKAFV